VDTNNPPISCPPTLQICLTDTSPVLLLPQPTLRSIKLQPPTSFLLPFSLVHLRALQQRPLFRQVL
jgi:hypothetical protein